MKLDKSFWFNDILFEHNNTIKMKLKPNLSRKDMVEGGCPYSKVSSLKNNEFVTVQAFMRENFNEFAYTTNGIWTYIKHDYGQMLSILEMIEEDGK